MARKLTQEDHSALSNLPEELHEYYISFLADEHKRLRLERERDLVNRTIEVVDKYSLKHSKRKNKSTCYGPSDYIGEPNTAGELEDAVIDWIDSQK